jgi:hypothetical protein
MAETCVCPHHAEEVDIEGPLPVHHGDLLERAAQHYPGVIHQDIDATHRTQSGFAQALDIGVPSNIAMHGHNTPAEGGDFGTRFLKPTVVDICDDEIRPASGHGQRGALANPTSATSDDRDFPFELHSSSPCLFLPLSLGPERERPSSPIRRWPSPTGARRKFSAVVCPCRTA